MGSGGAGVKFLPYGKSEICATRKLNFLLMQKVKFFCCRKKVVVNSVRARLLYSRARYFK